MGKALTGELSCPVTGLVLYIIGDITYFPIETFSFDRVNRRPYELGHNSFVYRYK